MVILNDLCVCPETVTQFTPVQIIPFKFENDYNEFIPTQIVGLEENPKEEPTIYIRKTQNILSDNVIEMVINKYCI